MNLNEYNKALDFMLKHNIISFIQYSELLQKGLPYVKR